MYIIGINAFHGDSSAVLLKDGILVAAAEEERFRRIKHWAGFPSEAIKYCLEEGNISLSAVEVVAINQNSKSNIAQKIKYILLNKLNFTYVMSKLKNRNLRHSLLDNLKKNFPIDEFTGKINYIDHHLCHLSSAFHVSPFDKSVVLSIDGFGDFSSGAWGVGEGDRIDVMENVLFPHSLGIFYQALTQYLGFLNYGDEYKVMGLAPYGDPVYVEEMRQIVKLKKDGKYSLNLDYFKHHKENVVYEWDGGTPIIGKIYSTKMETLLGPARNNEKLSKKYFDIARSVQFMYEEAFFHILRYLHKTCGIDNLSLAGGCAMNSVANGKIRRNTPFKNIYIQSAAGDAGGAVGAAFIAWRNFSGSIKCKNQMKHAYWGPSYTKTEIGKLLDSNSNKLLREDCKVENIDDIDELCNRTALAISEGKVIGWFQGRMEWGPRALGNRSILCDPRRSDIKDILNLKIKRRESFRPFAPSVLRESVDDWFEENDDVPFMMKVFQIREKRRKQIPAVTHVDGSGRLQTVCYEENPKYYKLIQSFFNITDVPMLLNTSFNENEPVVCSPEEALACFLRTNMDVLVFDDYMVTRK